jgi:MSHA biogenesis protein MshP
MNQQKGITLIGAIFVVVIVSLLGIYLVKITGSQRQTVVMNLQSARAYYAANAGIEWGIARLVNAGSCIANSSLSSKINGFSVSVECDELNSGGYNEAGTTINIYQITATSEYGVYGNNNYASRTLSTIVHGP